MEDRLVLICEGGAHTVEYFHKNGVYPSAVVFNATKYREMIPYLTENDEVLVLVKGLTDFTLQDIYAMLNDILDTGRKLKSVTVMSNIHLGKIPSPYYLYSGDLFYGEVKKVENNKVMDLTPEDIYIEESEGSNEVEKVSKNKKNVKSKSMQGDKRSINGVIKRYTKYNKRNTKITIYGSNVREVESTEEVDEIVDKLIKVDLFNKSK